MFVHISVYIFSLIFCLFVSMFHFLSNSYATEISGSKFAEHKRAFMLYLIVGHTLGKIKYPDLLEKCNVVNLWQYWSEKLSIYFYLWRVQPNLTNFLKSYNLDFFKWVKFMPYLKRKFYQIVPNVQFGSFYQICENIRDKTQTAWPIDHAQISH